MNFLPFARPTIDEATIAAVSDTLRCRWIATGPRVAAFEKALSERFGGLPLRALTSATAAMQVAL
ncbi:MAG: DegT/DnrJ/EryC1/StrS aminotransferase family protein, partial [Betaproteobacteria bacterium]